MPVKPGPGETVRQVTDTTVLPASSTPGKAPDLPQQSDFMDWIESQPSEVWQKRGITVRLRRGTESNKGPHCIKLYAPPDKGPFGIEWVRQNYGGGDYRLLAEVDGQLRYNVGFSCIGAPKDPEFEVTPTPSTSNSELGMLVNYLREKDKMFIDEIRRRDGGDNGQLAVQRSMQLQTDVLSQAVPAVAQIISRAAGSSGGGDQNNPMQQMMMAWMGKMLERLDAPQRSSLAETLETLKLFKESGLIPAAVGKTDLASTMLSMAPQVIGKITEGMQTMARMKEIELEELRMGVRRQPPPQLPAARPQPMPSHQVQVLSPANGAPPPAAAAPPPKQPATTGNQFLDFIQYGIVNILLDPAKPLEDAAHECLVFLDSAGAAQWVDQMIAAGEDELLNLFRTQPILQNVPQNPRLTEFIKVFLRQAAESRQPAPGDAAPDQQPDTVLEPPPPAV
jgi:hypothetical protein